ncbi:MAG TPA: Rv3235 family protein [Trebonia sp.]|nr:Rv3235 family protein [Trebonia sp.]
MISATGDSLPALTRVPEWSPSPQAAVSPACWGWVASADRNRPATSLGEPGPDWPTRFARVLTEALAGARPAGQILPWTTKRARSQFLRLLRAFGAARGRAGVAQGGLAQRGLAYGGLAQGGLAQGGLAYGGGQPRIVRVVASRPARDTIEMSVIAWFGERVRALAVRLERTAGDDRPGQWICTDIEAA